MVAVGAIGAFATFVVFAWRDHDEDTVPADEVARIDGSSRAQRHAILSREAAE
jgi:cytochrome o ubiquinol oxidase subunit 1